MDLALLEAWNRHWNRGAVSPLVLRHPEARAAVSHMVRELLQPQDDQWSLRPGPRQIGKTTSLGHVMAALLAEGVPPRAVVFAPLDQYPLLQAMNKDLQVLIEDALVSYPATPNKPLYLLVDEIQELPLWDQQLKGAWDRFHDRLRVVATGSGALRLVRTSGASLANRVRITRMFPMKFREVIESHPVRHEHIDGVGWDRIRECARAARQAFLADKQVLRDALDQLRMATGSVAGYDHFLRAAFHEYCVWGGYPPVRAGGDKQGVARNDFFEAAWSSIVAHDLPHAGIRDVRKLGLVFRTIGANSGGKFVPANVAKQLEAARNAVTEWKQVLEDLMLVQQLPALKPNLTPGRGKDKAYVLDPGWCSHWNGVLDHRDIIGKPEMGLLLETVIHDHVRRLRYNLLHTTFGEIGYVQDPEVDLCIQLRNRWLLIEVKAGGQRARNLEHVGGPDDIRLVISHKRTDISDGDVWTIPAYLFALLC